ncbi:MAG: hypothetical protein Q4F27_03215, partial [Desulfovibrionaceae bacterium]|nr:hypothetical protein [Desulfovibrionaceae bacterium]
MRACEVAILLVNWRNTPDTLACLEVLAGLVEAPLAVIVVDNGSGPEAAYRLAQGWAGLWQKLGRQAPCVCREGDVLPEGRDCLLLLDDNRGFAGGNNAALRALLHWPGCRAVWLLNNDTLPEPEALAALCAALNAEPKA